MQFVTHAVQNLPPWSRVRTDALIEAVMQPGLVLTLLNPPQPIAPNLGSIPALSSWSWSITVSKSTSINMHATKLELVINLETATTLDPTVPLRCSRPSIR